MVFFLGVRFLLVLVRPGNLRGWEMGGRGLVNLGSGSEAMLMEIVLIASWRDDSMVWEGAWGMRVRKDLRIADDLALSASNMRLRAMTAVLCSISHARMRALGIFFNCWSGVSRRCLSDARRLLMFSDVYACWRDVCRLMRSRVESVTRSRL